MRQVSVPKGGKTTIQACSDLRPGGLPFKFDAQSRGGRRLKSFPRNQRRYRLRISETVPSFGASGTGLRACLVLPGWNSGMPSPVPMEYAPAKGPYGSAARPVKRQQTVTRLRKQRRGTVQTVLPGTAAPLLAGPPVQLISSRQNVRRVE